MASRGWPLSQVNETAAVVVEWIITFHALPVGGEIVSTFGHPELVKLGRCDLIEQVKSVIIH